MNCQGFGKYEGICRNQAGGDVRPKSRYWCDRCERLRRIRITKQLESLVATFPVKEEVEKLGEAEQALKGLT